MLILIQSTITDENEHHDAVDKNNDFYKKTLQDMNNALKKKIIIINKNLKNL